MEKRDVMHRPHPEYRYWLYDPEGDGMTYYRTQEARDDAAEQAIGCYLEDGWALEVECVSAGEVTHFAQVLDKTMRPADEDLEDGCDDDGMDWPEGMAWRGNYALEPLTPNVQGQGRCAALSRSVPCTAGLGLCALLESQDGEEKVSFLDDGST